MTFKEITISTKFEETYKVGDLIHYPVESLIRAYGQGAGRISSWVKVPRKKSPGLIAIPAHYLVTVEQTYGSAHTVKVFEKIKRTRRRFY